MAIHYQVYYESLTEICYVRIYPCRRHRLTRSLQHFRVDYLDGTIPLTIPMNLQEASWHHSGECGGKSALHRKTKTPRTYKMKITECYMHYNTSSNDDFCMSKVYPASFKKRIYALTTSQGTLDGPVYTGMLLECHWLTQCTLGYHWATQRVLAGCTGTPLEKLSWNRPTLDCHWIFLVESAPHWNATGETNFCSLHWNTTGGTVTAHTRPGTYS